MGHSELDALESPASRPGAKRSRRRAAILLPAILLSLYLLFSSGPPDFTRWRSSRSSFGPAQHDGHSVYNTGIHGTRQDCRSPLSSSPFGAPGLSGNEYAGSPSNKSLDAPITNALEELHYALETMQTNHFQLWVGKWPDSIDWTGAVLGTYVSATLFSLSRAMPYMFLDGDNQSGMGAAASVWTRSWNQIFSSREAPQVGTMKVDGQRVENEINKFFSQSVTYYFGEDAFAIRQQAFDDMLWVVLGWLESAKFIALHSEEHYPRNTPEDPDTTWYGEQFVPAFAHRARVFYDLAKTGWGTDLCGGGMNWNPYLTPYKNAITNELFISASIGMYLYFPGDLNPAPFAASDSAGRMSQGYNQTTTDGAWPPDQMAPHNDEYLNNAIDAYDWLKNSHMTNDQGLYVDGFHIRDWGKDGGIGTGKCDVRNEMVYTYNQGVVLSGLRGLWEATGDRMYLSDGHTLMRNVLEATGWDVIAARPKDPENTEWQGLGRAGILEDHCDSLGSCSQNGHTFKGIFFHHLTLFCEPLPDRPVIPDVSFGADKDTAALHAQSCREYATWVGHNAAAAMRTRDERRRFGMWWGAGNETSEQSAPLPYRAVDYRNWDLWQRSTWGEINSLPVRQDAAFEDGELHWPYVEADNEAPSDGGSNKRDLNDRGRGRTVETQGGGVAVLRALWEFMRMYRKDGE